MVCLIRNAQCKKDRDSIIPLPLAMHQPQQRILPCIDDGLGCFLHWLGELSKEALGDSLENTYNDWKVSHFFP